MAFDIANNPAFSPANLLMLSGNVLAGPNFATGLGTGLQQLSTNIAAQQKEQAERQKQIDEARQAGNYLRQQNPGVDLSNFTPAMVNAAAATTLQKQLNPAQPEFKVLDDGTYGTWDGTKFTPLGKAQKPQPLPAIAQEYNWAKENGFTGTPQEYQMWKANLSKQKGMVIESTPDGGFRMVQGDVDASKMPKLTEAEGKNAGFYLRAQQSEGILSGDPNKANDGVIDEGTSLWNKAADAVPVLGNYAKSKEAQKYDQAKRDFINAILRRESGAVISPAEFQNAEIQYFPQPGDDPATIKQKNENRAAAIAGLKIGSGPAADQIDSGRQDDPMGLR